MPKYKDLSERQFGRLKVISRAEDHVCPSGYRSVMWLCECDCGNKVTVRAKSLLGNVSQSCGCLQKELASKRVKKHGGFGTRLYAIWDSMRQRCYNPRNQAYKNYGARGITVQPEWNDFQKFREWALQNGYDENAPRGEITLDRIDVNKNYYPENCRWVNMGVQSTNKRNTVYIEYQGEQYTINELSKILDIPYGVIHNRRRLGWSDERIVSTPYHKKNK